MNSDHTVNKVDQEISFITDRIHQVREKVQFFRLIKVLFLNDLSKKYEKSCQLLEFHVKTLNQMIEMLSAAEICMKSESEIFYKMNIITESARRAE